MATYTIDLSGDPGYQAFGEGLTALAKAFTPDYEGEANARLRAAQTQGAYAGAYASEQQGRERAAAALAAENANRARDAMVTELAAVPASDVRRRQEIMYRYAPLLDIKTTLQEFGDLGLGVQAIQPNVSPETVSQFQTGAGMAWDDTVTGVREGLAAQADREEAARMDELVNVYRDGQLLKIRQGDMQDGDRPVITKSEAEGAAFLELTPEEQAAVVLGTTGQRSASDIVTVDRTTTPVSRKGEVPPPVTTRRSIFAEDLRPGSDVIVPKSSAQGTIFNYVVPGAEGGTPRTYLTRDGVTDLNGNPLPPGGYRAGVTGSAQETGVDLSESEARNVRYLTRMQDSHAFMNLIIENSGGEMPLGTFDALLAVPSGILPLDYIKNLVTSPAAKIFTANALAFMSGILRSDTGAAAPLTEYPLYYLVYIPMPGDSPSVLEMKRINRESAIRATQRGLPADVAVENILAENPGMINQLLATEGGKQLVGMFGGVDAMKELTYSNTAAADAAAAPGGGGGGGVPVPQVTRDPNTGQVLIDGVPIGGN